MLWTRWGRNAEDEEPSSGREVGPLSPLFADLQHPPTCMMTLSALGWFSKCFLKSVLHVIAASLVGIIVLKTSCCFPCLD